MKTNKAYKKRIKVTRTGKTLTRIPGQNHFNAKASRRSQLSAKRLRPAMQPKKILQRYLPYSS